MGRPTKEVEERRTREWARIFPDLQMGRITYAEAAKKLGCGVSSVTHRMIKARTEPRNPVVRAMNKEQEVAKQLPEEVAKRLDQKLERIIDERTDAWEKLLYASDSDLQLTIAKDARLGAWVDKLVKLRVGAGSTNVAVQVNFDNLTKDGWRALYNGLRKPENESIRMDIWMLLKDEARRKQW